MVIGIDPDVDKSGVAIAIDGKLTELAALPFYDLLEFIEQHRHTAHFVVEDVEWDRAVYTRPGTNAPMMKKISQDVGKVKMVGRLIGVFLAGCDAQFILVKPLKGPVKLAKKDAKRFNKMTGWTGKSNEDKRDAALLALYGTGIGQRKSVYGAA